MTDSGIGLGLITLIGFAVVYGGVATCLVCFIAPICAGSGLPEAKGPNTCRCQFMLIGTRA